MAITTDADIEVKATIDMLEHTITADGRFESKEAALEAEARGQGVSGYETLTLWQTAKKFKLNVAICFAVTFSAATDGYQIGMNGNIIANPGFVKQFATQVNAAGDHVLASPILSGWSSIMSVGQIIGMTTLPFLSDRFGRKAAMFYYWFVLAISILLESVARNWPVWLVAKLLAGIGVGCLQSTIPTYIAEVAPTRIRGGLLMSYSFWFGLGNFFAPIALQVLSKSKPDNWLIPVYTQWGHIGIMFFVYLLIPESPAWCVTKGKYERAKKALRTLYWDVKDYDIEHQFQLLVIAVDHEVEVAKMNQMRDGTPSSEGSTFIGITLFSTFASYFFQQAGLDDPFEATCITTAINIAVNVLLILTADKVGRRFLSCSGSTLSWIACIAIGILGVSPRSPATNKLLVFFTCLWNIGFVANGATGWGFIGEISSQRLRTYTAGFGASFNAAGGVIMNVLTPYMVNSNQWNWGLRTGWFYAGVGLPFIVGMWLLIPETKGLSPAELDELFETKIKPWRFHKTKTATQRLVDVKME